MRTEDLLEVIGEVDDELLERSEKKAYKKIRQWKNWIPLAACACLLLVVGLGAIEVVKSGGIGFEAKDAMTDAPGDAPDADVPAEAPTDEPACENTEAVLGDAETDTGEPNYGQEDPSDGKLEPDYAPMIMVDSVLYYYTYQNIERDEISDEDIVGYTSSYTDTEPVKDAMTNFDKELGAPYARYEGGVVVLVDEVWWLFEKPGAKMLITESTENGLIVRIDNNNEHYIEYGKSYYVQRLVDGNWCDVPTIPGEWAFPDIAIELLAGDSAMQNCSLEMYGDLPAGTYRIVKEVWFEGVEELTAVFEVN